MNNPGPFFNPFQGFMNYEKDQDNYDRLINKINRLEKDLRILENRLNKIEKIDNKPSTNSMPTDMYML